MQNLIKIPGIESPNVKSHIGPVVYSFKEQSTYIHTYIHRPTLIQAA